jgi:hypothetical protein
VLNDDGKEAATGVVADRLARGEQVLALDVIFSGKSWKDQAFEFAQMLDVVGDRTIGLEAAQLIGVARWAEKRSGAAKVRIETVGIRTQVIALVAAALEPELFAEIVTRQGMHSLSYVFDLPVEFEQAPELFCLDLYKEFDVDSLEALAAPAQVHRIHDRELP